VRASSAIAGQKIERSSVFRFTDETRLARHLTPLIIAV
jgi:hypothetical protein